MGQSITPGGRSLSQFASLVWTKAWFNLKSETRKNYLSYLWWIIEPVMYMIVFYVIFGLVLERGGPGFVWYLITGLVPYQWFSKTILESADSISKGKGLMRFVHISPLFFPLYKNVKTCLKQIPVFIVLFLAIYIADFPIGLNWIALIPILLAQFLFMMSLSFVISLCVPYARDLIRLIPIAVQFVLFSSGIFYSTERIPGQWQDMFYANPMAALIHMYREVLVDQSWPDANLFLNVLYVTAGLSILAMLLYWKLAKTYARVVNE